MCYSAKQCVCATGTVICTAQILSFKATGLIHHTATIYCLVIQLRLPRTGNCDQHNRSKARKYNYATNTEQKCCYSLCHHTMLIC